MRTAALTSRASASRSRLARSIELVLRASIREMVGCGTPERRASSAWDQPRDRRSSAIRRETGAMETIYALLH